MSNRPMSRGGMQPPPGTSAGYNPAIAPLQQGTGVPGTAAGRRPGTGTRPGSAASRGPPGTGMKPPPGTGYAGNLQSINTNIHIADRPITQQGMGGMRTAVPGQGRQVQDKSYFLGQIRNKIGSITDEMGKLQGNIETSQKDNSTYGQLERKYENLSREMRSLQGQLADLNLLLDRSRSGRELIDIQDEFSRLKSSNDTERQKIDSVFTERSNLEARVRDAEMQMYQHHQEIQARMDQLSPQARSEYQSIHEENQQLLNELPKKQTYLVEMQDRLQQMEGELSQDPNRQHQLKLREQLRKLNVQKAEIQAEMSQSQLSTPEQKEAYLSQVKRDNLAIADSENTIGDLTEALRNTKQQLNLANSELEEAAADSQKSAKYDELFQRDQEMQALIDGFDATKAEEERKISDTQESVVALLQRISRAIESQNVIKNVDKGKLTDMKTDLDFKQEQVTASVSTKDFTLQEKQRRRTELEKINTLDQKISTELLQRTQKIQSMQEELVKFQDIPGLRAGYEERKRRLLSQKGIILKRRDCLKQQVALLKKKFESSKEALQRDDTSSSLEALERKMKHYEENKFVMQDYVDARSKEGNYVTVKTNCERMVTDVNSMVIKQVTQSF